MNKQPEIKIDYNREEEKAKKYMEWLIGFMSFRFRFVYQTLMLLVTIPQKGMGTMGVRVLGSGKFQLSYDPLFVNSFKDEELTYVFYHEVAHIALHHCTSRKFPLRDLGNVAIDLAVNELIPVNSSCQPPRDSKGELIGCYVEQLQKEKEYKDLKTKQSAEYYYDYLLKKQKKMKEESFKDYKGVDNHDGHKEDPIGDIIIRNKIDEIAKGDLWGDMTSADKETILAAQVSRINWANVLRQYYGLFVGKDRESTYKRPNRKGIESFPGQKKLTIDRHLVAIDTSGSIDSECLSRFLGVLNQMTDHIIVDVMQFDCDITEKPRPFDRRKKEYQFTGRGGTDFQPVISTVDKYHYRSVVILTDGCASAPIPPKNASVVWLMPEGCTAPVAWGKKIFMTKYC